MSDELDVKNLKLPWLVSATAFMLPRRDDGSLSPHSVVPDPPLVTATFVPVSQDEIYRLRPVEGHSMVLVGTVDEMAEYFRERLGAAVAGLAAAGWVRDIILANDAAFRSEAVKRFDTEAGVLAYTPGDVLPAADV